MSVNPVSSIQPLADPGPGEASLHRARPAPAPQRSSGAAQSDSGTTPNRLQPLTPAEPAFAEIPQDEVEVQRDSGTDGEIVIRYVDSAGNVVLQVPSSQVLGMAHAVDQDLEREQARTRADVGTAQPAGNGGKLNGN